MSDLRHINGVQAPPCTQWTLLAEIISSIALKVIPASPTPSASGIIRTSTEQSGHHSLTEGSLLLMTKTSWVSTVIWVLLRDAIGTSLKLLARIGSSTGNSMSCLTCYMGVCCQSGQS